MTMLKRLLVSTLSLAAIASITMVPVQAQVKPSSKAVAAKSSTSGKAFVPPKTPWADPDIQGVWTSDSVRGIPMERPANLAGKAELSDEEYAQKVARDEQTRKTA